MTEGDIANDGETATGGAPAMDGRATAPLVIGRDADETPAREGSAATTPIIAIIVATVVLYFAKEIAYRSRDRFDRCPWHCPVRSAKATSADSDSG
jgi:hypothetical protein